MKVLDLKDKVEYSLYEVPVAYYIPDKGNAFKVAAAK
jgi:hypothetical protein